MKSLRRVGIVLMICSPTMMMACAACGPQRPLNGDPSEWTTWCQSRNETCSLCAGEGECGYCPTTNECLHYAMDAQEAKTTCPTIIKNATRCPQE
jgi:hypothetical protein